MTTYRSVADTFRGRVAQTPDAKAYGYPGPEGWAWMTWKEVHLRVKAQALGLRSLGLEDEQRVSILSSTRVDWVLADLAVMCSGGATTTIYPSTTAEGSQYILSNSGSNFIFVENDSQAEKIVSQRENLPDLKKVIVFDGQAGHEGWVITRDELEALGRSYEEANPEAFDTTIDRIDPEKLATLIYTSGTTGRPKGVQLVNDSWLYVAESLESTGLLSGQDLQLLWLPLSHVFGKMLLSFSTHIGIPVALDGRIPNLVENLAIVKPTFVAAVPRIFEKIYNKSINTAREGGALKYRIFRWALSVGRQASQLLQKGQRPTGLLALKYKIADKLVFSKLRAKFGGRLRFFISGSAPLNREIAEFFHAAGLLILEGYGLTESSAASVLNRPDQNQFGTVGVPLPGTEIKLAESDKEILIKSRGIMRGYYKLPEASAECLEDGWLKTGDIGEMEDGVLRITDRKKDLIKTSGGKYVAPQALEGSFKALCPFVSQIVVHGNRRNYCCALLTMDEESILKWASENGLAGRSYAELAKEKKVIELFQGYIDTLNTQLERYETLKKFALLPQDFSIESGELTPSQKVKRKLVESNYQEILDSFYSESFAQL